MSGMHEEALAAADLVVDDPTATYLDEVLADIAAGAAQIPTEPVAAHERLERAKDTATPAGDAAAIALATAASAELGSDVETRAVQHLGEGWKRVVFGLGVASERRIESA